MVMRRQAIKLRKGVPPAYKEPIDAADAVCKQHDICYYLCRQKEPCDPNGRSDCMRHICDATLILEMPSTGVGPLIAAGIDFFNEHPDPGKNAPTCPNCKASAPAPPSRPCSGFTCLDNR
jgi:hypothetical protein